MRSSVEIRIKRSGGWALVVVLGLAVAMTSFAACSDDPEQPRAKGDDSSATAQEVSFDFPQGSEPVDLDPDEFTTDIDNPWWPMEPGTRWTYRPGGPIGRWTKTVRS